MELVKAHQAKGKPKYNRMSQCHLYLQEDTYPAKTPPANTSAVLISSLDQNSGEPGSASSSPTCERTRAKYGDAKAVRMRKRMAGSDFGFMTVLVKEGNVVVRHVIAVNVTTYPDSETPLFFKEKNNSAHPHLSYVMRGLAANRRSTFRPQNYW